jgi:hypothetical protein
MEIVENFDEAGKFTGKLFSKVGNLIILIILSIIPIVNFIVVGYLGRIIRDGKKITEPPVISDYGKLFFEGLKIVVATIVYAIVPIIILVVLLWATVPITYWTSGQILAPGAFMGLMSGVGVIALIVLFAFLIIGVIAIGNMIRTDNFMKIFAFSENWKIITKIGFTKYIIWLILVFVIGLICAAISGALWIVGAVVDLIAGVFIARSFGTMLDEVFGDQEGVQQPSVLPPPPPF